jgi:hypothetical protein
MTRNGMESLAGTSSVLTQPVVHLTPPRARILIADRPDGWRQPIKERLDYLCQLSLGWDGYRARPVSFSTAHFALRLLESVCDSTTPAPSIVPGPSGDLQIEWHLKSGDIELHVRAPNDVHAWRETLSTGENGEELRLTIDFTLVARWVRNLSDPQRATVEAAA